MSVEIALVIKDPIVKRGINYRLLILRIRKFLLANRPRSDQELKKRIKEYLNTHPKAVIILENAGVTIDVLVYKFSAYAK